VLPVSDDVARVQGSVLYAQEAGPQLSDPVQDRPTHPSPETAVYSAVGEEVASVRAGGSSCAAAERRRPARRARRRVSPPCARHHVGTSTMPPRVATTRARPYARHQTRARRKEAYAVCQRASPRVQRAGVWKGAGVQLQVGRSGVRTRKRCAAKGVRVKWACRYRILCSRRTSRMAGCCDGTQEGSASGSIRPEWWNPVSRQ